MKIITKNKIFFSADHHYNHSNLLGFESISRPFQGVKEMDAKLIAWWNEVVGEEDLIFYLGDLSFSSPGYTRNILDRLNGKLHWIRGNHDKYDKTKKLENHPKIVWVKDYFEAWIPYNNKEFHICMFHYPIAHWSRKHHGSIHLHGHSHGNYKGDGLIFDVGIDNPITNFRPIQFETILDYFKLI